MKLKFKKKIKVETSEFWYDISSGGYIKAEDFSDDPETIKAINDAVKLLQTLENKCELV